MSSPSRVGRPVEQAGDQVEVGRLRGDPGERAHQRQLVVAARLCGLRQRPHRRREPGLGGGTVVRVHVQVDRRGRLPQHGLDRDDVALAGDAVADQLHEVAAAHLRVAGHVPGGAPAQRARQRRVQLGE